MNVVRRFRPTPALIVAILALLVATSGGAYAVTLAQQAGDKIIKINSLSGNRLTNDTVTGAKIKESTLGKVPSAAKADVATKANSLPKLGWHGIPLSSGWTVYQTTSPVLGGKPYFTKDASGFVHLKGAIGNIATDNRLVIGTLPTGFRPADGAWVPIGTSGGSYDPYAASLWIDPSGIMTVVHDTGVNSNNYFVSLEGVQFYAG